MTNPITSLDQLNASAPTVISAETEILIPGCYPDFDGNTENATDKGARHTLRHIGTDARIRDLVIG